MGTELYKPFGVIPCYQRDKTIEIGFLYRKKIRQIVIFRESSSIGPVLILFLWAFPGKPGGEGLTWLSPYWALTI